MIVVIMKALNVGLSCMTIFQTDLESACVCFSTLTMLSISCSTPRSITLTPRSHASTVLASSTFPCLTRYSGVSGMARNTKKMTVGTSRPSHSTVFTSRRSAQM
ncbi:unnamed protein product [Chrysodeixis includens]|uniref:Secreted protein n=1 Tax=Chrysodeixis includens TaxID=689277 RepID=A0A9N8L787_CHRIL|nr:unnamed protein product [Chrysodeixis includens]